MDQLDLVVVQLMIDEARKDKMAEVANKMHQGITHSASWLMMGRDATGKMPHELWLWILRYARATTCEYGDIRWFRLRRKAYLHKLAHRDFLAFCMEVARQAMQYRLEKLGTT